MNHIKYLAFSIFLVTYSSIKSQCSTTNISSLIPNPSFEINTGCPSTTSQLHLATGWNQASSATTDYFNCTWTSLIPFSNPPLPTPNGSGYIGFHDSNNGAGIYKEYAGACLTGTMTAGTSYTLQFYISSINTGNTNPVVSIFGTSSCANLPFGGGGYLCPTAYAGWTQLATTSTVAVSTTWTLVTLTFTPSSNINAVAIGPGCTTQTGTNYYYLDNLILNTTTSFTPPTANAGANKVNNCTNTTNILNGSVSGGTAGYTYAWSPSTGLNSTSSSSPIANPTTTTNYTLTVTDANGCVDSDQVTVTVNKSAPTANAGADKINNCISTPTLNGSGGGNYSWSPSTGLSSTTSSSPTANPSATTNYTLTVTNTSNGCIDTDQVTVNVNTSSPTANAGTDETTTCITPDIILSGSGGGNYSWSPSTGLSSTNIATPTADPSSTTTYTLTVTDPSNGCTDTDQVTITVDETDPVANAGADILIDCAATTGTLTGTGGVSYMWNTPSGIVTGPTLNLTGTDTPGTYTLTATAANGCTDNDDATVTIDQVLPISVAGPDLISNCATPTVTMDGSNSSSGVGITYQWTGPSIMNGATTNIADCNGAGTYYLTVTAPNSCTQIDSLIVVEDTNYPVANAGLDQILDCNNTVITLDGSGSDAATDIVYSWATSNGNITTSTTNNTVDADLDGSYTITVTNTTNGCISTDDVDVTQDTITPVAIITSPPLTIDCNNPSGSINASTSTGIGNTYLWTTTNGSFSNGANTSTPTVDLDGTYNLTITSANGCVNLNPIAETVLIDTTSPTISIKIADTLTCNILEITLDASSSQSGVTYQWITSNGSIESGDQTSTPIIGLNGTYELNIVAPNGCSSIASVAVVNSEPPVANMIVDPLEGFQPLYVTFTDSSSGVGLEYSWDFGTGDYDDSQNTDYTYVDFGEFESILTVTDQYGCSDYDTTIITVFELSEVLVPNIFSPNGDGVNDIFIISGGGIKNLNAQILNRWGQIIYEWDTPFGSWDGFTLAGEKSASGSYFYFIEVEYNNGDAEEFKGNVVLVR